MECWRCRYPFEHDGEGLRPAPAEGDVTMCWQCGVIGIVRLVDGAPSIEPPTPAEVVELQTPAFVEQAAEFELRRQRERLRDQIAERGPRRG